MEHDAHAAGVLAEWALALERSGLGELARGSTWLYPLASVAHILGMALLLGNAAAFDLRVLGLVPALPLPASARLLLRLALIGFVVQLASGAVMLAADASHLARHPLMQIKLAVILVALANIAAFHLLGRRGWQDESPGPGARVVAVVSLLSWASVACLGRLIAYT